MMAMMSLQNTIRMKVVLLAAGVLRWAWPASGVDSHWLIQPPRLSVNPFEFDGLAAGEKAGVGALARNGDAMLRRVGELRAARPDFCSFHSCTTES